jgi:hypothetical protein
MANGSNKKKIKAAATKSKGRKTVAGGALAQTAEKKKKEMTADEMLLRAWKKTYENRGKRIDG